VRTMRAYIVGHGLVECSVTTAVSLRDGFVPTFGYYGEPSA
jgi:hypothetical protein